MKSKKVRKEERERAKIIALLKDILLLVVDSKLVSKDNTYKILKINKNLND
jgi:CRISPR/Cas system-associated protein Cas10 (large subunit of type III CRISPR-Cas system)